MINSLDSQKAFNKTQPLFMIKVLQNLGPKVKYLNIIRQSIASTEPTP